MSFEIHVVFLKKRNKNPILGLGILFNAILSNLTQDISEINIDFDSIFLKTKYKNISLYER